VGFSKLMQEALQNGASWLGSTDTQSFVRIELVNGVSTLFFFLDKDTPGQVRFKIKDAQQIVTIAEFMSEIFPSLPLEIERIEMRRYIKESGSSWRVAINDIIFQAAPNDRQLKERDDLAKYEDLHSKCFKKIFPVWREVANGSRATTWTSAQSTDALNYFCAWLICREPTGSKAQFFLDASEQEIALDLDTNYLEYTDPITDPETTEYYLKGDDPSDATAVACFRERWPSLTMAPSGQSVSHGEQC
jgi:hypothetical protein